MFISPEDLFQVAGSEKDAEINIKKFSELQRYSELMFKDLLEANKTLTDRSWQLFNVLIVLSSALLGLSLQLWINQVRLLSVSFCAVALFLYFIVFILTKNLDPFDCDSQGNEPQNILTLENIHRLLPVIIAGQTYAYQKRIDNVRLLNIKIGSHLKSAIFLFSIAPVVWFTVALTLSLGKWIS